MNKEFWVEKTKDCSPNQKLILMYLFEEMERECTKSIRITIRELCTATNICRSTMFSTLKTLEEKKLIKKERRMDQFRSTYIKISL